MKRTICALTVLALWAVISVIPANGQTETASISGAVQDSSRQSLPGVTVTATYIDTDSKVTKVTDGNGKYSFADLKPGNYLITASLTGFATTQQYATLSSRKWPDLIFIMQVQVKPNAAK